MSDFQTAVQDELEALRHAAQKSKNNAERFSLARRALALWRQSLGQMSWALDIVKANAPEQPSRQAELWCYLSFLESTFPAGVHGNGGWAVSLVPTDLHEELLEALAALPFGEVQPILEPAKAGLHGLPYSLGIARLLAVEHVEFLVGRGSRTRWAQDTVAAALGIEANTLRSWRDTLLPGMLGKERVRRALQIAREAGEFTYPEQPQMVNADVLSAWECHTTLDLKALGEEMRKAQ
jgi:hypothetical protein